MIRRVSSCLGVVIASSLLVQACSDGEVRASRTDARSGSRVSQALESDAAPAESGDAAPDAAEAAPDAAEPAPDAAEAPPDAGDPADAEVSQDWNIPPIGLGLVVVFTQLNNNLVGLDHFGRPVWQPAWWGGQGQWNVGAPPLEFNPKTGPTPAYREVMSQLAGRTYVRIITGVTSAFTAVGEGIAVAGAGSLIFAGGALTLGVVAVAMFAAPETFASAFGWVDSTSWVTAGSNDSPGITAGRACVDSVASYWWGALAGCQACCETTAADLDSSSPVDACRAVCNAAYQ